MKKNNIFIHKTSDVERGAQIGAGTKIWHFTHIFKDAHIGKDCNLGQNVVVHNGTKIGNNVKIQNNVSIYTGVELDDDVFCGPSCVFTNIITPRSAFPQNSTKHYKKTIVGRGATIGANSTILCGITIGQHAFIGAGSTVTKNVQDYELVYGNPAKHKGWISEAGTKLTFKNRKAICPITKVKYVLRANKVSKDT